MKILSIINCLIGVKSIFYFFILISRNMLKLIKRKVNSSSNCSPDDTELSELLKEDREIRRTTRRSNLEESYQNTTKALEDLMKKQKDIEEKIDFIGKANEEYMNDNQAMASEINEKKVYLKNLETMLILMMDFLMVSAKKLDSEKENERETLNTSKESTFGRIIRKVYLNSISEEDISCFIKTLVENLDDSIIRSLLEKCLETYDIKLEDINISMNSKNTVNESSGVNFGDILSVISQKCQGPPVKNFINLSHPSSTFHTSPMSSTSDKGKFAIHPQTSFLKRIRPRSDSNIPFSRRESLEENFLRKKKDISYMQMKQLSSISQISPKNQRKIKKGLKESLGDYNLSSNSNMFEEVNSVAPCLISSPSMSPARAKKSDCTEEVINIPREHSSSDLFVNTNLNTVSVPLTHQGTHKLSTSGNKCDMMFSLNDENFNFNNNFTQ